MNGGYIISSLVVLIVLIVVSMIYWGRNQDETHGHGHA
jgi:hypothetical protein